MKYYIAILIVLLVFNPVSADFTMQDINNAIQNTLNEIDLANNDGAEVQDLYDAVDEIVFELERCGWSDCDEDLKETKINELQEIRQIAKNRQNGDFTWVLFLLLPIGYVLIKYRNVVITRIRWYILSKRRIKYED